MSEDCIVGFFEQTSIEYGLDIVSGRAKFFHKEFALQIFIEEDF